MGAKYGSSHKLDLLDKKTCITFVVIITVDRRIVSPLHVFVRLSSAYFLPVRIGLGKSNKLPKKLDRYGNIKEAFLVVGLW